MNRSSCVVLRILAAALFLAGAPALGQGVRVTAPSYTPGAQWTVIELDEPSLLPMFERGWQRSTFWDLRPATGQGRLVRWSVSYPDDVGLGALAEVAGADTALCARRLSDGSQVGCRLISSAENGPGGLRAVWSSLPGGGATPRRLLERRRYAASPRLV